MLSMNDKVRMLRPAPYGFETKECPEYDRWYNQEGTPRARPLDANELARYLVKYRGMGIKAARLAVKDESLARDGDKALWLACLNPVVERIIEAMQAEVKKHGLDLMQHYPLDLTLHDKNQLLMEAVPGARFAWTVHDTSTNLSLLGVHPERNKEPTYLLNLSSRQKFYELKIREGGFALTEVSKKDYEALSRTPIPYRRIGEQKGFVLEERGRKIGSIGVKDVGNSLFEVEILPEADASPLSLVALSAYAQRAPVEIAHTLFVRSRTVWKTNTVRKHEHITGAQRLA